MPERVYKVFSTWQSDVLPAEVFLGVNHTGASFTGTANQIRINGRTTADAGASYRLRNATITLRVRNLSNKLYADYGGRASSQVLLASLCTAELGARLDC